MILGLRQVRWYNDAYLYSFQDRRWALIPQKPNAQVTCVHSIKRRIV